MECKLEGKTLLVGDLEVQVLKCEAIESIKKDKAGMPIQSHNALPYPLIPVEQFQTGFQRGATGVFFGAGIGDAFCLHFQNRNKRYPYMVRPYVGNVNAVSGFQQLLPQSKERRIQDYIVVEPYRSFDLLGFHIAPEEVRQFRVTPLPSNIRYDGQTDRRRVFEILKDVGFRFEVTPLRSKRPDPEGDYFLKAQFGPTEDSGRAMHFPVRRFAPMRLEEKLETLYHGTTNGRRDDIRFENPLREDVPINDSKLPDQLQTASQDIRGP